MFDPAIPLGGYAGAMNLVFAPFVYRDNAKGTESLLTLRWREQDSNSRSPVKINVKVGPRRARTGYSRPATECAGKKEGSNSGTPLESTPTLNPAFAMSGFDRGANGPCRGCSSGFGAEVRLFLENHTRAAANG
jgi:hypothetical protein